MAWSGARSQQMPEPNPRMPYTPYTNVRIAWTEPDRLLLKRDPLLDRSGQKSAPAEMAQRRRPVTVERDYRVIFGNGLLGSALRAKYVAFGQMRQRTARR